MSDFADRGVDWRVRMSERIALANRAHAAGAWEWDLATSRFTCDVRTRELYGLGPDEPVSLALLLRMTVPEDRQRIALEFEDAARGTVVFDTEFTVLTSQGDRRNIRTMADLVRDALGRPVRLVGTNWDDTLSQRLVDDAHERQERLQVTLASIGDAVITTDAHGIVTFLNGAAEALVGWDAAAAVGVALDEVMDLTPEEGAASLAIVAQTSIREKATRRLPAELRNRNGDIYEVETTVSPIRTRRGHVIGAVLVVQDVTRQKRMERELRHAATHDALTGLANRSLIEARLCELLDARGPPSALCYIDVDQFKIINDTAGHPAGDQFLRQISGAFANAITEEDLLARIGGDEFALVLTGCDLAEARIRAQALVEAASVFRFVWEDRVFTAGASIGLCAIDPRFSPAELLSQSDVACYAAKAAGRGRVSVYRPDDADITARHQEIVVAADMREVIRQNRFILHAQKIVPNSGRAADHLHVELLVRMIGKDGGLVSPGVFIPAAERFDLMGEIDRWVLTEALQRLAPKIRDVGALHISVNLSGNSLNDPGLLDYLLDLVRSSPLPGSSITFEVTETAALNNLAAAGGFMRDLRALGCKIALDDFGVGLSSFAYLKTFPVDRVKIDGSFIRNLETDEADRAIVESMNALAHKLGAETVAEFVENQAIADLLAGMGVDFLQGYAFGRPEPFEAMLDGLLDQMGRAAEPAA